MSESHKKLRGPITAFVDWFMVDPVTTGVVIAPLVVFACVMAYLTIRDVLAGRF
jgi:hypothetical protein